MKTAKKSAGKKGAGPAGAAQALSSEQQAGLLKTLSARFEKNKQRHAGLGWAAVLARLEAHPDKLGSLQAMEETGGEPDVVGQDAKTGEVLFYDCSAETPAGRRSLCFDQEALDARKEFKPKGSAMDLAEAMGVALLTESEYRALQQLGEFDLKTSSWIATPEAIRKLDGGLFCDRRFDTVFVYHNGVQSYYAGRGFRGSLRV